MPRVYRRPGRSVYLTRFKVNGQRYELSTGEKNQARAEAKARELQAEKRRESPPAPRERRKGRLEDLSVMDLEERAAAGASEESCSTSLIQWSHVLAFFGPDCLATDVQAHRITAYVNHRRGSKVRAQTIRKELQALKRGLLIAESRGWLGRIPKPWPKLKNDPKDPNRSGRFIPPPALEKFLAALPDELRDELLFSLLTGLRGGGELRKVRAEWAEPAPPKFPTPAVLRIPAASSKTRSDRTVGLPAEAMEIVKRRSAIVGAGNPLFPRSDRRTTIGKAAKAAGIPFRPHRRDLRHTFATLGDLLTGDRKAVQDAMGHTTEAMTGRYIHGWNARTAKVAIAVASVVGGDKSGVTRRRKKAAADFSTAAGAWDWTRTSMSRDTNPSSPREGACPLCGCVGACSAAQRDDAGLREGGGDAPGVTRKGAA